MVGLAMTALTSIAANGASAQTEPPSPDTLSSAGRAALLEAAKQPQPSSMSIPDQRIFIDKYQETFGALQRNAIR